MPNPLDAERDYMECQILDTLFAAPSLRDNLLLSGGATITKSYHISYRISQDLDLIWTDFNDVPPDRSRRQLRRFKDRFKEFVFDQLRPGIHYAINQDLRFMITTDREWRALHSAKPQASFPTLHLLYKSMLNNSLNRICIEIMPRKYDPSAISFRKVVPYSLNAPTREIPMVIYAQTFWDKVFALHSIANGLSKHNNDFISRHYFDVAQMADMVNIGETYHLFQDTIAYQNIYTAKEFAPINNATEICLIPDAATLCGLATDYYAHNNLFIEPQPGWDKVVDKLQALKMRLSNFNITR